MIVFSMTFFFSSRRRHTMCLSDWSSDVCSSDLSVVDLVVQVSRETSVDEVNELFRAAAERGRLEGLLAYSDDGEIGRASCRERMKISVVAVAVEEYMTRDDVSVDVRRTVDIGRA